MLVMVWQAHSRNCFVFERVVVGAGMDTSEDCPLHSTTNTINSSIVMVSKEEMPADLVTIMLQQTDDAKEQVLLLEMLWHTNIEDLHAPATEAGVQPT